MLEWYVLSVVGFALGFDQHRSVLIAKYPYPAIGLMPVIFDAAAWLGGVGTLAMLIAGFFFGSWWWPLLAMAVGTGVNFVGRTVMPMELRWVSSISATLLGFIATVIFFR